MSTTVAFTTSEFSTDADHADEGHYATRWQIRTDGSAWWPALIDSGWSTVDKLAYSQELADGDYEIRVAFMDEFFIVSEWSDPVAFTVGLKTTPPPSRKAWAFTLDGHIFYVLGSFDNWTILYDLTAKQWTKWRTGAFKFWNAHRGVMWRSRVFAADIEAPIIWEVDPTTLLDEDEFEIERAVTGFQPHRGDSSVRQGSMRMIARQQTGAAVGATLRLRFSDDGGRTWCAPYSFSLANPVERLEFRSLGRMRKPGRIWEITDVGGLVCIDGAEANLEGA